MSDIDEAMRQAYEAQHQQRIDAVLGADLEVAEVTTTVELRLKGEPRVIEEGTFRTVEVSVTRFVTDALGPDRDEPYYSAKAYVTPTDRRKSAWWTHLPGEVAKALVGRALL